MTCSIFLFAILLEDLERYTARAFPIIILMNCECNRIHTHLTQNGFYCFIEERDGAGGISCADRVLYCVL